MRNMEKNIFYKEFSDIFTDEKKKLIFGALLGISHTMTIWCIIKSNGL